MVFDAVKAAFQDKLTVYVAGMGFLTWATLELWLKYAGAIAGSVVPIASLVMIAVTIYVRLYPRQPTPLAERKDIAKSAWSWGKRFGVIAAAVIAVAAVFMFWKSEAKAAQPPQALVSAPAGKRKRSGDDTGGDTTDDVPDSNEPGAPKWFWKAKELVGVAEALPNGRANPDVKKMFGAVDGFDPAKVDCRNVPWCAVFVNYVLSLCSVSGTRSAMARSFSKSRAFVQLDEPRIGCIVVMWRGRSDDGETGHVGFYAGARGDRKIVVLGGNQHDQVEFEDQWKTKVLGYYWPRGKLQSKQARGGAVAAGGGVLATGAVAYGELADDAPAQPAASTVETVTKALEAVQQPLEASGHPKAIKIATMIGLALMVLSIGGAAFMLWQHSQDHSAGRL